MPLQREFATASVGTHRRTPPRPVMLLLLAIVVAAPLWHLHVIDRDWTPAQADLVSVWVGERAALSGNNPYSPQTTDAIQRIYYGRLLRPTDDANPMAFAYPAHTLVVFSLLAPLSWPVIRSLSLIILPILAAAGILLWLRIVGLALSPRRTALVLVLALASIPALWGIHQLQPTVVVFALAAAGCFLLQRGNPAAAGLLLAFATIKPQLVAPLILWLCLWSLLRRQWSFLIAFSLALSVLLISAQSLVPGWIPAWRASVADYVIYRHLRFDLAFLFGGAISLALAAIMGLASVAALWRNRRCPPESPLFGSMAALCLSTSLILQPTDPSMIYNHLLLLPACLILVFRKTRSAWSASIRRLALAQLVIDFAAAPVAVLCETLWRPCKTLDYLPFADHLLPALLTILLTLEAFHPLLSSQPVAALDRQETEPVMA